MPPVLELALLGGEGVTCAEINFGAQRPSTYEQRFIGYIEAEDAEAAMAEGSHQSGQAVNKLIALCKRYWAIPSRQCYLTPSRGSSIVWAVLRARTTELVSIGSDVCVIGLSLQLPNELGI